MRTCYVGGASSMCSVRGAPLGGHAHLHACYSYGASLRGLHAAPSWLYDCASLHRRSYRALQRGGLAVRAAPS